MLIKSMLSVLSRHSAYLHQSPLALLHTSPAVPASALATLRKNTGYSLSICKKALGETGDDVQAAEKWLREQAQAQGWAKAQKLQGRNTSQGLLGVLVRADTAAMVEVNCETDFVARNQQFVSLLQQVAASCVANSSGEAAAAEMQLSTTAISPGELGTSPSVEAGKTVGDLVALSIGQVGENISLGPAAVFRAGAGVRLAAQCHPSTGDGGAEWQWGRYAGVVAYTTTGQELEDEAEFTRQLCQHIVGMGPTHLDNAEDKENSLLHQTFLLDEEKKVREVLDSAGVTIIDFVRVEVGRRE